MGTQSKGKKDDDDLEDEESGAEEDYDDDDAERSRTFLREQLSDKSSEDGDTVQQQAKVEVFPEENEPAEGEEEAVEVKDDLKSEENTDVNSADQTEYEEKKHKHLGHLNEKRLTQMTRTRQDRRTRVGYVKRTTTSRFGNLCSPFQALNIRDTENVSFKEEMPMSNRMIEKGMTCTTEKDLSNMMLNNLADYNDMETGGRRRGKGRRPGTNTTSRNTATPMSTQSGSLKTTSNSYR